MVEEYKYKETTGKIIGAAMQVHIVLGNSFQEGIYQRAMEIELPYFGLNFSREFEMPILKNLLHPLILLQSKFR